MMRFYKRLQFVAYPFATLIFSLHRTASAFLVGSEERSLGIKQASPVLRAVSSSGYGSSVGAGTGDDGERDASVSSRRRDLLQSAAFGLGGAVTVADKTSAQAATTATTDGLVADLPMIRVSIPTNGLGKAYVAIPLCLPGQEKPVEFMLDTGLTLELMTPHLRDKLGLSSQASKLRGLAAGGKSSASDMVTFRPELCSYRGSKPGLVLPELHATVTDFPQEHIDPKHAIEGMLGQEFLSRFDVDLDFPAGRVRLYRPGTANKAGFVPIPAVVINETGLLGIRLSAGAGNQPILAFIDCGSTFSAVNWQAAAFLGLPPKTDPTYRKGRTIYAVGIDGRPLQLPTIPASLSFAGDAQLDTQGRVAGFESPPTHWKPWKSVHVAVGDLPVFPEVLGDGVHPYTGPAGLIGLDILGQRRCIIESAGDSRTRMRRIFVSPS